MKTFIITLLLLCCMKATASSDFRESYVPDTDSYYPIVENGKWGFIDAGGKVVISTLFENAHYFSEGFAAIKQNGKYGYINRRGEVVIEPRFEYADQFNSGVAVVQMISPNSQTNLFGLINKKGDFIVQPDKPALERYQNIFFTKKEPNGNYAVMLPDGTFVTEFIFLGSVMPEGNHDELNAREFPSGVPVIGEDIGPGDGLIQFIEKGLYGYMTDRGQVSIPAKFDFGYPFNNGEAVVKYNGLWGIIDKNGVYIVTAKFERLQKMGYNEGLCGVRVGGKWGFMDRKEKMVIKPQFWRVGHFSDGTAIYSVNTKKSNHPVKHGYIDRSGKPIHKASMVYAEPYKNGLAFVTRTASEGRDPYVVDKKNREIFLDKYNGIVQSMNDELIIVNRETKGYMVLDRKTFKPILEFEQKMDSLFPPVNGIMYVCFEKDSEKATYGYMDMKGKVIYRFTEVGKKNVGKVNF